ncbi:hypothetical protein Q2941_33490 [Bradyrhizobium sp. UFLA05-153]
MAEKRRQSVAAKGKKRKRPESAKGGSSDEAGFILHEWIPETETLRRLEVVLGARKPAQRTLHEWRLRGKLKTRARCFHRNGRVTSELLGRSYWQAVPWESVGVNAAEIIATSGGGQTVVNECFCYDKRQELERLLKELCSAESQEGEKDNETYEVIRAIVELRNPEGYGRKSTATLRRQVLHDFKVECEKRGLDPGNDPNHPSWDTVARALGRRQD